MSTEVRLALPKDAAECANIHIRSWIFAYGDCIPKDILNKVNSKRSALWKKMLENNQNSNYVLTYNNTVVGFIGINPSNDEDLQGDICELTGLYLDPDHIGKGFGKLAMNWLKEEIRSRGYNHISLWVLDKNMRAKAFYEKSGFKADGKSKDSGLGNNKVERYIFDYRNI